MLPRIGEGIARRIVHYREAADDSDLIPVRTDAHRPDEMAPHLPQPPVFTDTEDLAAVRGIGPKTIQRIRLYLRFDPR